MNANQITSAGNGLNPLEACEPIVVTDEDLQFALALVPDAELYTYDELMAEARRRNEESAAQFEWSVLHGADSGICG